MANPRVSSGEQKDIIVATVLRTVNGEPANVQLLDMIGLQSWSAAQASVGTAAAQLAASPLSGRRAISVRALAANSAAVYLGPTSAVTTASGFELSARDAVTLELDETAALYAIAAAAGQRVAILEIA